MSCSGSSMNGHGATLFSRRPTSNRSTGSITGKVGSSKRKKSKTQTRKYNRVKAGADAVSSVATLLHRTEMFPSKTTHAPPASSFLDASSKSMRCFQKEERSSSRSILGPKTLNATATNTFTTCTRKPPATQTRQQPIRQLHAGGWGGRHAGSGIKDGFVNIRVKNLRTGVSSKISEYCRGKVCVLDFWMTKTGQSSLVSMDA